MPAIAETTQTDPVDPIDQAFLEEWKAAFFGAGASLASLHLEMEKSAMSETPYPTDKPIPRGDRILIVVDKPLTRSRQGIFIPSDATKPMNTGVVAASGQDLKERPLLRVGDRVVFNVYSGQDVSFEAQTYKLLKEADVLCILPPHG